MSNTIEINGQTVKVLAEGIKKFGREWTEIEEYPTVVMQTKRGDHVYSEDGVVIEEEGEFKLFMNNGPGFMVYIELQKEHYEEKKGFVVDRPGHIYFTMF